MPAGGELRPLTHMNRLRPVRNRRSPAWPTGARAAAARVALAILCFAFTAGPLFAQVRGQYLYSLSDFAGRLTYDWARVAVDEERDEIYVVYGNVVRVFGSSGMEIYAFGDDLDVGRIADVAVERDGNILLFSVRDSRPLVTRCDFRGVPIGEVAIRGLPPDVVFTPNRMMHRDGRLYFASFATAGLTVTDVDGRFREHVDLLSRMELDEKEKASESHLTGFHVDAAGNVFFTIATHFKAYKLTADRTLQSFGRPGAAPGRFSIVAGIVTDSRGNVLVADKLKSVVMVFDPLFNFITEFGTRGTRPEHFIVPDELSIDRQDRLYVTQGRRRGISVFALKGD